MNIELIQAAQQAVDAFDAFDDADDFESLFGLTQKMGALRTAIQQAEAKTDEPVAWGWAIVDNKGLERRTRARIQDFFGSNQEAKPFSLEDVAREDREFAGCAPHRVITLFTHPEPGVPDDVARDAISSVREQYRGTDWGKAAECVCDAIDDAMTAAQAQKGQP